MPQGWKWKIIGIKTLSRIMCQNNKKKLYFTKQLSPGHLTIRVLLCLDVLAAHLLASGMFVFVTICKRWYLCDWRAEGMDFPLCTNKSTSNHSLLTCSVFAESPGFCIQLHPPQSHAGTKANTYCAFLIFSKCFFKLQNEL